VGGILHGGAVMALADTLGGVGAFLNLAPHTRTATVESKTNFLRPARIGAKVIAKSRLINKGRTLLLWQTEIKDGEGIIGGSGFPVSNDCTYHGTGRGQRRLTDHVAGTFRTPESLSRLCWNLS
jgi:acyl-coenzyme A thioesterase PaaI-like protein